MCTTKYLSWIRSFLTYISHTCPSYLWWACHLYLTLFDFLQFYYYYHDYYYSVTTSVGHDKYNTQDDTKENKIETKEMTRSILENGDHYVFISVATTKMRKLKSSFLPKFTWGHFDVMAQMTT